MKRSFILTEISSIGICLLLISQMMFPETFTGAWFRYAILTLMTVTILSTQKGERLRVYDRQRQLCLTPFLWCYWWVEKILIGITVLCLFVSKWGIYSALSVFLLFDRVCNTPFRINNNIKNINVTKLCLCCLWLMLILELWLFENLGRVGNLW